MNINYLLVVLTYLSMFIVVITLLHPFYKLIISLIKKIIRQNDCSSSSLDESSHRKYKKLNSITDSCSACLEKSSSSSNICPQKKSNKKYKIKFNKNKINNVLKKIKLD
jgi:ABC-type multidrug transport system fused ATPase/permease subunit